jgi:hypothetical protein
MRSDQNFRSRHFEYATQNGLVVLTRNYDDFAELHDVVLAAQGRRIDGFKAGVANIAGSGGAAV